MGGVDVQIHVFLASTLVGGERSASRPCRFTPGTHWIGGWVDPRASLDEEEKLCPYRDSSSDPSIFQPVASRYTVCATAAKT
jgi:hypothetical protein